MKKTIFWLLGTLFLLLVLAVIAIVWVFNSSVAPYKGTIQVAGIEQELVVEFDAMGIPLISSNNSIDAWYAMGWVHASERLFQMDMTRKVAQGRLSELLGSLTLKMDIESRKIGHAKMAKEQLSTLSLQNEQRLQAYADGVNSFVKYTTTLPFEFYLLGYNFEPWKVEDCLSILSFQTWYSDALQNADKLFVLIAEKEGLEKAKSMLMDYPESLPFTIPQSSVINKSFNFKTRMAQALVGQGTVPFQLSESSNSWVTAPQRSASGHAMLASDPHLETTRLPQFWYYLGLHLQDKDLKVAGITTAGLPFFVMGTNMQAAWAFTAGGVDVTEYYQEKVHEENANMYKSGDSFKPFTLREEMIKVSDANDTLLVVKSNSHGPVIYQNDSLNTVYTLDWAGFDTDLDAAVTAGFNLAYTQNFTQFRKSVTQFGALDANWTYADREGNIGFQLGTPVAKRPEPWQNLPVKGWENERVWKGYYSADETPHILNPERGWLVSANNKQQSDAHLGYTLHGNFADDRIARLQALMEQKEQFTMQDFKQMQLDLQDPSLLKWKPLVLEALNKAEGATQNWKVEITNWQGSTEIESRALVLLHFYIEKLKWHIFYDELGENYSYVQPKWIYEIVTSNESSWFDNINTPEKETKEQVVKKAINAALKLSADKTWGAVHPFKMAHPFSIVPGLRLFMELEFGPWPWPGTQGTPNAAFSLYKKEKFDVVLGPSWRFIVDFAQPGTLEMVLPTGNSGNPMSPYFANFIDYWKQGRYWKVQLNKSENHFTSRLSLKPQTKE